MGVVAWVVKSSANTNKISLTLKAGIPFLVLLHIGSVDSLGTVVDNIVNLIVLVSTWLAGAAAIYGAFRKVWITIATFFKPAE